jgi:hypothetical protein
MANNNRIFYANQQFEIAGAASATTWRAVHGLQLLGTNTNFNTRNVNEIGQVGTYQSVEGVPNVELTCSKVLDGYPLIGHLATVDCVAPTLVGRINGTKAVCQIGIYPDTNSSATGTINSAAKAGSPNSYGLVQMSGMYMSSWGFNFPLEDDATEECTFVGNDKIWLNDSRIVNVASATRASGLTMVGKFNNADSPQSTVGIALRQHFDFANSRFPTVLGGISTSGTNESTGGIYATHVGTITCRADCKREEIFEQGHRFPYVRVPVYPIEVTSDIELIGAVGDNVSMTEQGILSGAATCQDSGNLYSDTIRLETCEGTAIYLGNKNKLMSVNYGGGDAKGGNVKIKYSFMTNNTFTLLILTRVVHLGITIVLLMVSLLGPS